MSIGYNHVEIVGRIVETPLYKDFGNNKMMLFSVSIPEPNEHGKIDFIPCIAFGATAELIYNRIDPNDLVLIDGKIKQYKFTFQNGNVREEIRVKVNSIYLIEEKPTRSLGDREEIMNEYTTSITDRVFAKEFEKMLERLETNPHDIYE